MLDFCWPKGGIISHFMAAVMPHAACAVQQPQDWLCHTQLLWTSPCHLCHSVSSDIAALFSEWYCTCVFLQEYLPESKKARGPAETSPAKATAHKPSKQPKKKMQQQLSSRKSPPAKARAKQQPPAARGQKGKQQSTSLYSHDYEPSTEDERPKKQAGTRGRGRSLKPVGTKRRAPAGEGRHEAPAAAARDAGMGKRKAAAVATDAGKGKRKAAAADDRRARDEGEQASSRRVRSRRNEEVRHCSCTTAWDVTRQHPAAGRCQLHISAECPHWTVLRYT